MVKYTEVMPLRRPEKRPPLKGNYMFPSWDEVQKRRKERNEKYGLVFNLCSNFESEAF